MTEILNLAFPFFGLILLGVLSTRFFKHGEEGFAWLNTFIIWFALPALIYLVIADAPFEQLLYWPFVAATSSVTLICFFAALLLGRYVFANPLKTAAIQATTGSYGNVGYMGLPLSVAFFGPEAAVPAALVFCFDCTIQFVLTPTVATLGHERDEEAHWGEVAIQVAKRVAGHPFIIATVLGALASYFSWQPPVGVQTILEMLMRSAGPIALFALGATVGMRRFEGMGAELPWLVLIKLMVQPLLAFAALSLVPGLDPDWMHVAVMMAALPTASNAFILARQYGTYIEGSSSAVIVTTLISAITIPMIIYVIRAGWL